LGAKYERLDGSIIDSGTARTFVDGQYLSRLMVRREDGSTQFIECVFVPGSLAHCLRSDAPASFYFWNSHLYAARFPEGLYSDVGAARRSFFHRDWYIHVAIAATIVLAPVSAWVAVRRLASAGSAEDMMRFMRP
jgi:hypothetical protein